MNKRNFFFRVKAGFVLGVVLLGTLTGCVGYVDGGGDYGGVIVAPEPDVYLFGGGYDHGRDVHGYSHRGAVSRGVAHPGGVGHAGGGSHGARR